MAVKNVEILNCELVYISHFLMALLVFSCAYICVS